MLKYYKMTFTQNKKTYNTCIIPAQNLADAYITIQMRFPMAEITEAIESNKVTDSWSKSVAKYLIANASLDEACTFASHLDEEKREELVNTIWDEWHKSKASKAV